MFASVSLCDFVLSRLNLRLIFTKKEVFPNVIICIANNSAYLESYNIFADSMFDLSTSPANISLNQTLFWSFQIRVPKVETINVQVKRFFLKNGMFYGDT